MGIVPECSAEPAAREVELLSDELTTISQQIEDEDFKIEALHHRWGTAYSFGQTAKLLEYAEEGIAYYDRDRHHKFSYVFAGHDPGACAYNCRALALGLLGRSRSVRPTLDAGLALASSLQHPLTLAFYLSSVVFAMQIVRDANGCRELAEQLTKVRRDTNYQSPTPSDYSWGARPMPWRATPYSAQTNGAILRGDTWLRIFGRVSRRYFGRRAGERTPQRRSAGIGDGASRKSSTPERGPFISELWRIRGEMALRQSATNTQEAEGFFANRTTRC